MPDIYFFSGEILRFGSKTCRFVALFGSTTRGLVGVAMAHAALTAAQVRGPTESLRDLDITTEDLYEGLSVLI